MRNRFWQRRLRQQAKRLYPVPDPRGVEDSALYVMLPADSETESEEEGRAHAKGRRRAEELAEAADYVETLEANGRIARGRGPLPPGATHQVLTDARGRKRLVRKRFSAR